MKQSELDAIKARYEAASVHACTDIPRLVVEVERLRGILRRVVIEANQNDWLGCGPRSEKLFEEIRMCVPDSISGIQTLLTPSREGKK